MISEDQFLGNAKIVRYLDRALKKGFVSHAYLFEGPAGIGKATLARRFAAELLDDDHEGVSKNPDLKYLSPEENRISVDAIRALQHDLSLYPFKAARKVAIIDQAELMNRTAANALLKTLEEPAPTAVLILVSSGSDRLLDTIRSRCQVFTFNTCRSEEVKEFVAGRSDRNKADRIAELAEGRPGIALRLLADPGLLKETEDTRRELLALFDQTGFGRMETAAALSALEKDEVLSKLDLWTLHLRRELAKSLGSAQAERSARFKTALDRVISVRSDLSEHNVSLKLALENLCLHL